MANIMDELVMKYQGKVISGFLSVFIIMGSMVAYFYNKSITDIGKNFEQQNVIILRETTDRKEADKILEIKIDSNISFREFKQFEKQMDNQNTDITFIKNYIMNNKK